MNSELLCRGRGTVMITQGEPPPSSASFFFTWEVRHTLGAGVTAWVIGRKSELLFLELSNDDLLRGSEDA